MATAELLRSPSLCPISSMMMAAAGGRDEVKGQSYQLTRHLSYSPSHVTSLAPIKCASYPQPIQRGRYSIREFIEIGITPRFDAFFGMRGGEKDGDGKMGIPIANRKIAQLKLSLLQHNIEIPETHLLIHLTIQCAISEALHPPFLLPYPPKTPKQPNTLDSHVNSWIQSIQAVTKLNGDRALEAIETQLRSEEVGIVMDCLRNAKRLHAAISFNGDTGLKDATDNVHKFNQLMKDFPLNELLSATDSS
ncbi:hypothetical protein PILCRDRAFT_8535 [Piloderma croceum F 1598]|uniref:Dynein heavy chain tail domain-containing protein n=1 Tax=Piloderma croceum (strain F 1598) TaxID=765440 RepID=A0A0C3FQ97_PILCF|nr:hypothetical protein PILCRDRAFT_8535 [Piloderma croceum F 1598]